MENKLTYVRKNQPIEPINDGKLSAEINEENIDNLNKENDEELKQSNINEGFSLKKFKDIPTPNNDNIYSLNNQNSLNYFGSDKK